MTYSDSVHDLNDRRSTYLQYLPAIFQSDKILNGYLLAFEQVLTGLDSLQKKAPKPHYGLEEVIESISKLLDPSETTFLSDNQERQQEFIEWLASWTAFSLRADLRASERRRFIANILKLYKYRGTKQNLTDLLKIYAGLEPTITEYIDQPHFFKVEITLAPPPEDDPLKTARQEAIVRALIELQKPAHTAFELIRYALPMQIIDDPADDSKWLRIGVNTFLGLSKG